MANTVIQLKYSSVTSKPPLLNVAEPAYSNVSGVLWIDDGTGVVAIGGVSYTSKIDNATASATGNTLILRDVDGSFSANVVNTNIIYGSLGTTSGVDAGTYGSTTQVPVLTVAANGLITNVTTSSISTSLTYTGDVGGPDSLNLVDGTLTFTGGNGITTTVGTDSVTFDVDTTVFRANTGLAGSTQFVDSPVVFTGNVQFTGNTFYNDVTTLNIADPIIYLAANNYTGDVVDIGFAANYFDGANNRHTGLIRHNNDKEYYLFQNYLPEPGDSNIVDPTDVSFQVARLHAEITGNVSANTVISNVFLANQGAPDGNTGYSFSGNEGGHDTGMFSEGDGRLQFFADNVKAGEINSGNGNTTFGLYAAASGQGYRATAIGFGAGQTNQSNFATAVGLHAGQTTQGTAAVAVGHSAGQDNQSQDAVAIGSHAGQNTQGYMATAIGYRAGYGDTTGQGQYSVAIGAKAGRVSQHEYSIAINASGNDLTPTEAGLYIDPIRANNAVGGNVAVYNTATKEVVYTDVVLDSSGIKLASGTQIVDDTTSVVIGQNVDLTNSNTNRVAIGNGAGQTTQGYGSTAVGEGAGNNNQSYLSVAIGLNSGKDNQGHSSVAVGHTAARTSQGWDSVAVGVAAGANTQGNYAVAIGERAGYGDTTGQGDYSIAIGAKAGYSNAFAGSIIFNASGSELNSTQAGFYVNPIRYVATQDSTYDGLAFYNSSSKEMTYSYVLSGGSF